jgi:hypothetical protein
VTGEHIDGASLIAAERRRQVESKGYDEAHDREHGAQTLCRAADAYVYGTLPGYGRDWPWSESSWKPRDRLSNLIRGGALYQASLNVEPNVNTELHLAGAIKEIDAILATARAVLGLPTSEEQGHG